jgi:hypothetical protein
MAEPFSVKLGPPIFPDQVGLIIYTAILAHKSRANMLLEPILFWSLMIMRFDGAILVRSLLHFSDIGYHVHSGIKYSSRHPGPHLRPGAAARLDPGRLCRLGAAHRGRSGPPQAVASRSLRRIARGFYDIPPG